MLCIGVNKIKIHFDTSQLCCGVVHLKRNRHKTGNEDTLAYSNGILLL